MLAEPVLKHLAVDRILSDLAAVLVIVVGYVPLAVNYFQLPNLFHISRGSSLHIYESDTLQRKTS